MTMMYWRVVSLLLVPTLFLQGLGFCHCLCGTCANGPAGHEERAHFHLSMVGLCHHAHKSQHAGQDCKQNGLNEPGLGEQAPIEHHDHDVVYVAAPMILGLDSSGFQIPGGNRPILLPMEGIIDSLATMTPGLRLAYSPVSSRYNHCPLYLRTLALLI